MVCNQCKKNIDEDSAFCKYCGFKLFVTVKVNNLSLQRMNQALTEIDNGVRKYIELMQWFNKTDVSVDKEFQRTYNGYYKVRQRQPEFYEVYYNFMQDKKGKTISFDETLTFFYNTLGRVEASFSSKLVATINTDKPIWDEFVLQNLNLKRPATYSVDRVAKTVELYHQIELWYEEFFKTSVAKEIIQSFDQRYPDSGINNVKKIDFLLWKIRD